MTEPTDGNGDDPTLRPKGVLVSIGRADMALYAPLREWMAAVDVSSALAIGSEAPDFFLPNEQAHLITLSDLLDKGPIILVFLPGGWCSFCINRVRALSTALRQHNLGVTLITPETGPHPLNMKIHNHLDCMVLADVDYGVGLSFGLTFSLPPSLVAQMKGLGIDLTALHGSNKPMLPVPALYVVAPSRKIVMARVELDYMSSADPEKLARDIVSAC